MIFSTKSQWILAQIHPNDSILDVGFLGQGNDWRSNNWLHGKIIQKEQNVYGIDLFIPKELNLPPERYKAVSAESFLFPIKFDFIIAGDLIEHLSNPGLFLTRCKEHLNENGRLVLTTPNAFNLFNMTEKLVKPEPTTNPDHVCYYNSKTLKTLLNKNGFKVSQIDGILSLEIDFHESWKKKALNRLHIFLSRFTPKFVETLGVMAQKK